MARKDISADLESIGIRFQVETARFLIEAPPAEIERALISLARAEHRARIIPRPPIRPEIPEPPETKAATDATPRQTWAARRNRAALELRRGFCGLLARAGLPGCAGRHARPEPRQRRREGI